MQYRTHIGPQDVVHIPNAWITDDSLTLDARGLLFIILSFWPEVPTPDELLGCTKSTPEEIRESLDELTNAGYLSPITGAIIKPVD